MGSQTAYSFKEVVFILAGVPITGFMSGDDVILVKRRTDVATPVVGADGNATVAVNADKSYDITFKLLQSSISNAVIQGILTTSDSVALVSVPIQIQNLGGTDGCSALNAILTKQADLQFGAGVNGREWTFFSNDAIVYIGGSPVL